MQNTKIIGNINSRAGLSSSPNSNCELERVCGTQKMNHKDKREYLRHPQPVLGVRVGGRVHVCLNHYSLLPDARLELNPGPHRPPQVFLDASVMQMFIPASARCSLAPLHQHPGPASALPLLRGEPLPSVCCYNLEAFPSPTAERILGCPPESSGRYQDGL